MSPVGRMPILTEAPHTAFNSWSGVDRMEAPEEWEVLLEEEYLALLPVLSDESDFAPPLSTPLVSPASMKVESDDSTSTTSSRKTKRYEAFPEGDPEDFQRSSFSRSSFSRSPSPRTSLTIPRKAAVDLLNWELTFPPAALRTPEQHFLVRKDLVAKYMRFLNAGDVNGLIKLCLQHCSDQVMFISPDIHDPCFGKNELVVLLSLVLEAYPDGVWRVEEEQDEELRQESLYENKVHCRFTFRGTKMFPSPMNTVFKQIKAVLSKPLLSMSLSSSPSPLQRASSPQAPHFSSQSLVQASMHLVHDMTECVHPSVVRGFLRADSASLGTPSAQAALLREGVVKHQRQANFVFDDEDRILRIVQFDTRPATL